MECAIDIGANIGNHTVRFLQRKFKNVQCFEPNEILCDLLKLNLHGEILRDFKLEIVQDEDRTDRERGEKLSFVRFSRGVWNVARGERDDCLHRHLRPHERQE